MRFTTWSTVTNVFIVSAVALLSLIPVANAQAADIKLVFDHPGSGDIIQAGENDNVTWSLSWIGAASENNVGKGLILVESESNGYSHILAEGVPMLDAKTLPVTYPDDAPPGSDYYLSCQTQFGTFLSDLFTITED